MRGRIFAFATIVYLLFVGLASPGIAASIQIEPLLIGLTPQAPIASMVVRNTGATPLLMQAEVMAWSQSGGQDVFQPTRAILANPPLFRVPPQGQQILRFGLRVPELASEQSYRVFLQEVPSQENLSEGRVVTLLRISVPVFVPPASGAPELGWNLSLSGKEVRVTVSNRGNVHAHILSLVAKRSNGASVSSEAVSVYVLAGQSRQWTLPLKEVVATGEQLDLTARTENGDVTAAVTVRANEPGSP